jgi:hypothetical protein
LARLRKVREREEEEMERRQKSRGGDRGSRRKRIR